MYTMKIFITMDEKSKNNSIEFEGTCYKCHKTKSATTGAHNVRNPERITSEKAGTHNVGNLERITPEAKYRPHDINIVYSYSKLIYTSLELKNSSIEFKGTGLNITGSTVGLIEKSVLDPKVIQNLKSTGSKMTSVGSDASVSEKVRGDVIGKKPDMRYAMGHIVGVSIFNHASIQKNLDVANNVTTFIQKYYRNILVPNKVKYTFDIYSKPAGMAAIKNIVQKNEGQTELYHQNLKGMEQFVINPRPEHLDSNSDNMPESMVNSSIENPNVKPASDSSTGGGVTKVDKSDLEKVVDQSESKSKPKKGQKSKNIVPPKCRPKRTRWSPDWHNITTKSSFIYTSCSWTIVTDGTRVIWTIRYGPYLNAIEGSHGLYYMDYNEAARKSVQDAAVAFLQFRLKLYSI